MNTTTTDAYRVVICKPGPASEFTVERFEPAAPAARELRIRHEAVGVNFLDVYFRSGSYPWPVEENLVTGSEAAGVVDAIGDGVQGFSIGDPVVYTTPNGAYATHRNLAAALVVHRSADVSAETSAASMLKGLTASYLINDSFAVRSGHTVLFHAAAGGVGSIAGQWLNERGATVIGTAGGAEKCALAAGRGYHHVIDYRSEDVAARVRELTDGVGVDVVYDSVGADTLAGSLASLKRFGTLVSFGQSSGPADRFRIKDLGVGSLYLQRPTLFHFTTRRDWLERASAELFALIGEGTLEVPIGQRFALDDVASAHAALESRASTGCTVLTV